MNSTGTNSVSSRSSESTVKSRLQMGLSPDIAESKIGHDGSALRFLFRCLLIPIDNNDSVYLRGINILLCLYMIFMAVGSCIFRIYDIFFSYKLNWITFGSCIWLCYTASVYTTVSIHSHKALSIFHVLKRICQDEKVQLSNMKREHFEKYCWGAVACTAGFGILNIVIAICNRQLAFDIFPLAESVSWEVLFNINAVVASVVWFLSVPVVCIPCHMLTLQIQAFINSMHQFTCHTHVRNSLLEAGVEVPDSYRRDEVPVMNARRAMATHDELYRINETLNSSIGIYVTLAVAVLGPLSVFMLVVGEGLPQCAASRVMSHVLFGIAGCSGEDQ